MLANCLEVLFGVWLLVSIAAQLPLFIKLRTHWNHFGLIPNWYFFTTPLLAYQLKLCGRRALAGGGFSEWKEFPLAKGKPLMAGLWNPHRRLGKALIDLAAKLVELRLAGRRDVASQSAAYQVLQRYARANGDADQFCIMALKAGAPHAKFEILFLSEPFAK